MQQQPVQLLLHIDSNMVPSDSEMEYSSEVVQGAQGCDNSYTSESGWTMYLNSTTYADHASDQDGESFDQENKEGCLDDDEDDSMASDASSGPSRRDTADYHSPIRHINGAPECPRIYHKQSVMKSIRREERFKSQVDNNSSQELLRTSTTALSSFRGRRRTKVIKNKQG